MSTRLVTDGLKRRFAGRQRSALMRSLRRACAEPRFAGGSLVLLFGCQAAYSLLSGAGLSEYYDFRARQGERGAPAVVPAVDAFAEFDAPAFQRVLLPGALERHRPGRPPSLGRLALRCSACG